MSAPTMRTKRRYAHELYPHPAEGEIRPLQVEVPYLYAQALGLDVWGTSWFDVEPQLRWDRTGLMLAARQRALLADALLQGLTGQEAWDWAEERCGPEGEWIWERAVHYGVDPDLIKPRPCGDEPDSHDHLGEPDARGFRLVTRINVKESDCAECCEPDGVS